MPSIVLTPGEKRAVAFVLAAFFLGLGTQYYRQHHPAPAPPAAKHRSAYRADATAAQSSADASKKRRH